MSATDDMVTNIRRMINEPDDTNGYTSDVLKEMIENYPCLDERGEAAYTWNTATTPPSKKTNTDWLATYDLHAAAADVWSEKAGKVSGQYGFTADGGQYQRQQAHKQMMDMVRFHGARRKPTTIRVQQYPDRLNADAPSLLTNEW